MNLFQGGRNKKPNKRERYLLSIIKILSSYGNLNGMKPVEVSNINNPGFEAPGVALLLNKGIENKGIPLRCDHYAIVLCLSGSVTKRQGPYNFRLSTGNANFIPAGEIHSSLTPSDDFENYVLLFERAFLDEVGLPVDVLNKLLDVNKIAPKIHLNAGEFDQWKQLFRQLELEISLQNKYYLEILRYQIIRLLYLIKRKHPEAPTETAIPRPEQIYRMFRAQIEIYFQQKRTVAEYAELMHITGKHLSETVKKVAKHTALHFIQERIIQETQYLLVYTKLNVNEISYKLNFDTPSHFIRFFKKHTGMTPLNFRRYKLT